jgi:hypothetical protein
MDKALNLESFENFLPPAAERLGEITGNFSHNFNEYSPLSLLLFLRKLTSSAPDKS